MTIKALYPTIEPTLNLDFANTKRLDPRITFSRASTATYFDENGTLRTAATNAARFDHNPVTGESLGLLVEEARTNLLTYSQQFDSTYYSTGSDGGSFIPNAIVAPDGTITASKLTRNAGTLGCWWSIYDKRNISVTSGTSYTVSCYLKAAEISTVLISGDVREAGGLPQSATFTLTGSGSYTLGAGTSAQITNVGNGWYRCSVTGTADATTTEEPALYVLGTGTSGQGFYAWGFQVEAGSFPTSYIPTPATHTGRASTATYYDSAGVIQTAASGVARSDAYFPDSSGIMRSAGLLLEAAGTNLVTYSEQLNDASWTKGNATVTANAIAAPNGTTTAELIYPTTTGSLRYVYKSVSIASGITTMSFFAKSAGMTRCYLVGGTTSIAGWFDLSAGTVGTVTSGCTASIERLSNGWHRCSLSQPISATPYASIGPCDADNSFVATTSATNGIYAWGGQLETSSFPTSYIPTTTTTVTRSADTSTSATVTRSDDFAQITGANFTNFFVPNKGTFFVNWSVNGEDGSTDSQTPVSLGTPTNDAFVGFLSYDERTSVGFLRPSSAQISIFNNLTGQRLKGVTAFGNALTNNTSASSAINGTLYNANATFNYGLVGDVLANGGFDRLGIGRQIRSITYYAPINGCISRIAYWPTRLSDANLQALTT